METEVWKDIPWYEWLYKVSNLWNVYSYFIKRNLKLTKKYLYKCIKWHWNKKSNYYLVVWLSNWINKKKFFVHRLVATVFVDNPFNKSEVNHIDWNSSNNCISNLEWVTSEENIYHAKNILMRWNFRSINVYKDGIKVFSFRSIAECSRVLNLYPHYISCCLNWHKKLYKWYTFD